MKVLSYLEMNRKFYSPVIKEYEESFNHIATIANGDYNMNIFEFYSQPFKPELITELFEGWYHDHAFTYRWNKRSLHHKIKIDKDLSFYEMWADTKRTQPIFLQKLRTLDDFINDCQRAGIELTWNTHLTDRSYHEQSY